MSISVIVPSCGRPNLEYTVQAILSQLRDGDELIVVSPRKPEVLKPFYDMRDDFVWVPFENGGFDPETLKSRNTASGYPSGGPERDVGKTVAKGTHLMVCDDDDLLLSSALTDARAAIVADPNNIHIFRMQYGCKGQWVSPFAKDLADYTRWNGHDVQPKFVLWGDPLLELGSVGSAMCVFPNDPRIKWDCSAPGGAPNQSEDYWVVRNFINDRRARPNFIPKVIGVIKPSRQQVFEITGVMPPEDYHFTAQPGGVGWPGWNGWPK